MENKKPEAAPPKKKIHPLLIILFISLGLELITLLFRPPSFVSTGVITNSDMGSLTIFIFYFIIIFIVWGIVQLIKKGANKSKISK